MEEGRSAFTSVTGKATGKGPLGRPRCSLEDSIKMDAKEIVVSTRNWVDSAQNGNCWRGLVIAINFQVPLAIELVNIFGLLT